MYIHPTKADRSEGGREKERRKLSLEQFRRIYKNFIFPPGQLEAKSIELVLGTIRIESEACDLLQEVLKKRAEAKFAI